MKDLRDVINEALQEPIKIGQKVKLKMDKNERTGQVINVDVSKDTVDVEFPAVQEKGLVTRTDRFYTDELIPVDEKLQDTSLQEIAERVFSDINSWTYEFCDWELFCHYARQEGYNLSDYTEAEGLNELKDLGYKIIKGKDGLDYITINLTKEDIDNALDDIFASM